MRAQAFASVIPGRGAAANPEPTGRGTASPIIRSHPVVGSGFSLREPRNDSGSTA
jgi:hypothetical protein